MSRSLESSHCSRARALAVSAGLVEFGRERVKARLNLSPHTAVPLRRAWQLGAEVGQQSCDGAVARVACKVRDGRGGRQRHAGCAKRAPPRGRPPQLPSLGGRAARVVAPAVATVRNYAREQAGARVRLQIRRPVADARNLRNDGRGARAKRHVNGEATGKCTCTVARRSLRARRAITPGRVAGARASPRALTGCQPASRSQAIASTLNAMRDASPGWGRVAWISGRPARPCAASQRTVLVAPMLHRAVTATCGGARRACGSRVCEPCVTGQPEYPGIAAIGDARLTIRYDLARRLIASTAPGNGTPTDAVGTVYSRSASSTPRDLRRGTAFVDRVRTAGLHNDGPRALSASLSPVENSVVEIEDERGAGTDGKLRRSSSREDAGEA